MEREVKCCKENTIIIMWSVHVSVWAYVCVCSCLCIHLEKSCPAVVHQYLSLFLETGSLPGPVLLSDGTRLASQRAWRIYLSLLSQCWGCSVCYGVCSSNTGTASQEFRSVWQALYQPRTSSRSLCFYLSQPLEKNQLLREIMGKFKMYSRFS